MECGTIDDISPIKHGDNERSKLSEIGSRENWFSRMLSEIVESHVWEAKT